MSFYESLTSNANKVKYDVTYGALVADTVNGATLPTFGTIAGGDLLQRNPIVGDPIIIDSGLKVTNAFNNVSVEPSSNLNTLSLTSQTSSFNINFPNGQLNKTGISEHSILFGDFSISANNGGTINGAGGQQINISNTGIDMITQSGCSLRLFINGMTFQFQPASTGNYYFPLTDGVAGQSLKTDGNGVLYWG